VTAIGTDNARIVTAAGASLAFEHMPWMAHTLHLSVYKAKPWMKQAVAVMPSCQSVAKFWAALSIAQPMPKNWQKSRHTCATVDDLVVSNWTDFHYVDSNIKLNMEYYPDILNRDNRAS